MGLTRKMLAAMEITEEKISEIMNAHLATVDEIKEERDALKSEAAGLKSVQKQLDEANAELEKFRSGDWQAKYEKLKEDHDKLKGEYDAFKTDTEAKAVKAKKESAFKQLLVDAGISDKRIASVMKVSGEAVDGIVFDDDGNIKDADKLTESVKTEWADFIATTHEQGASTPKPPANDGDGGHQPSRAAQMVAQYRNEHYGNPAKED